MIYYFHRENYDSRYYKVHWRTLFPEALKKSGLKYKIIEGPKANIDVPKGHIYDEIYTFIYKFDQLSKLLKDLKNGRVPKNSIFFFSDLWFPGLEALAYIRNSMKLKFYIVGVLHAGTFTPGESRNRYGMTDWAQPFEESLLTYCDKVFLASNDIKQDILNTFVVDAHKLIVTGIPFNFDYVYSFRKKIKKENLVVFPHRLDSDKQPEFISKLKERLPSVKFIASQEKKRSKIEYYDLLSKAKVCISASIQENFGYSMLEGITLGCVPIAPNQCVYPELYPEKYLYNNIDEAVDKIHYYLENWEDPYENEKIINSRKMISQSIPNMLKEVQKLKLND